MISVRATKKSKNQFNLVINLTTNLLKQVELVSSHIEKTPEEILTEAVESFLENTFVYNIENSDFNF